MDDLRDMEGEDNAAKDAPLFGCCFTKRRRNADFTDDLPEEAMILPGAVEAPFYF
jgi:hypothetical protein